MKKMPCLFVREFHDHRSFTLTTAVTPGCEWVLAGEGTASRKRDGTACAVLDGRLYGRYDAKRGKTPPPHCLPCDDPDPVTGHHPHWEPVGDQPKFKWHAEARDAIHNQHIGSVFLADGTYELCGPMVSANPERLPAHTFIRHGLETLDAPRTFDGLRAYLAATPIEGIVFAHPDGRFAKIRRKDFGLAWPA